MYAENIAIGEKIEQTQHWSQPPFVQTVNRCSNEYITPFNPRVYSDYMSFLLNKNNKIDQLNISWQKEYDKYSHYIKANQINFQSNVQKLNQAISRIHYEDYEIELTPNNSVKYTLLLPDKKILMITKSFESYESKAEKEIVFSIFENKKLILSDIKNLDEFVTGINRYIYM